MLAGNVASGYGRVCVRCVLRLGMVDPVKALAILELLLARTTQPKIFFCTVVPLLRNYPQSQDKKYGL